MNGLYDEVRDRAARDLARAAGSRWRWPGALRCSAGWSSRRLPNRYEAQRARLRPDADDAARRGRHHAAEQQKDVDTIRQTLTAAVNLEKVVRGTDLANTVVERPRRRRPRRGLQTDDQDRRAAEQSVRDHRDARRAPSSPSRSSQKLIDSSSSRICRTTATRRRPTLRFLDSQLEQRQKQLADAEAKRAAFPERNISAALPGTGIVAATGCARRARRWRRSTATWRRAQTSLAAINGQMAGTQPNVPARRQRGVVGGPRARAARGDPGPARRCAGARAIPKAIPT